MLTVLTWLWGTKYSEEDVNKLAAGLWRHLKQTYQMVVVTDRHIKSELFRTVLIPDADRHMLEVKGCFVRLRMFDPQWQDANNLHGRIVCMDLDSVVTGDLDSLFCRAETLMILQGANAANPCPFNGSLMMFRSSHHADLWTDFSLDKVKAIPFFEFPDDQGWIWHKKPNAAGWKAGHQSGVYAFQKPGWPKGDALPKGASLVVFPGWRSPDKFKHLPWVKEHWAA